MERIREAKEDYKIEIVCSKFVRGDDGMRMSFDIDKNVDIIYEIEEIMMVIRKVVARRKSKIFFVISLWYQIWPFKTIQDHPISSNLIVSLCSGHPMTRCDRNLQMERQKKNKALAIKEWKNAGGDVDNLLDQKHKSVIIITVIRIRFINRWTDRWWSIENNQQVE